MGAMDATNSDASNVAGPLDGVGRVPGVGGVGPGFEDSGAARPEIPPQGERPVEASHRPLSFGASLVYSSGNFGAGSWFAFNNFILPLFLQPLGMPPILIALLSNTRSFEGAILQPLVGAWSDRTWSRFGRRRVFIVRFVPISAAFTALTLFAPQLAALPVVASLRSALGVSGVFVTLALVTLCVFLFTFTFNVMYDPYQALLADITPERQRGRVNGVFQASSAFGQVALLVLGAFFFDAVGGLPGLFLFTAVALLVFYIPTVAGVREPRELPGLDPSHRYSLRDYWDGLRADRQIQLYFAAQFFLWFGINSITPFLSIYAEKEVHLDASGALRLSFILLLSSAIFVWPLGLLADRIGLKRVFLLGMLLLAGASLAAIFTRDATLLYIILAFAGLGNAAQTASSYPLLTRLVFPDQMGLYTGLGSTFTSLASPISALLTGGIIQALGFNAMFPVVATVFLLSLIPLALLRVERSRPALARQAARDATVDV